MPPRAAHLVACSEEEAAAIFAKLRGMLPILSVLFKLGRCRRSPGTGFGVTRRLLSLNKRGRSDVPDGETHLSISDL
jgi:hypothetical protein